MVCCGILRPIGPISWSLSSHKHSAAKGGEVPSFSTKTKDSIAMEFFFFRQSRLNVTSETKGEKRRDTKEFIGPQTSCSQSHWSFSDNQSLTSKRSYSQRQSPKFSFNKVKRRQKQSPSAITISWFTSGNGGNFLTLLGPGEGGHIVPPHPPP